MTRENVDFIGQIPGELPRFHFHYLDGDHDPQRLLPHSDIGEFPGSALARFDFFDERATGGFLICAETL
jgi:hypothetical protein